MDDNLKIKIWLYIFIAGLILSGITAFPLEWQMGLLHDYVGFGSPLKDYFPNLSEWRNDRGSGLTFQHLQHFL